MAQKPQQRSAVFGGEKLKHQKSILGVRFDLRCFHHYCCEGFLRFMMLREDLKYVTGCIISLLIYTVYNGTLTFKSTCTCWKKTTLLPSPSFLLNKNTVPYTITSHPNNDLWKLPFLVETFPGKSNRGVFCWKLQQICFWAIQLLLFQAQWIFSPR